MAFMELVIFAQSRRDNLFQVKSHQVQNFLDSHSKRKSAAGFAARRAEGMRSRVPSAPVAHRPAATAKKLRDSERIPQL